MSRWCFLIILLSLFQICLLSPPLSPCPSHSLSPQLCLDDERSALLQLKLDDERSALLQLKQKHFYVVPYSNYDPLKSWKPDIDCCYWKRITCNSTTGHVLRLELSNSSLSGSIHSKNSLFHLHHLQMLILSYNDFSKQIPSQISQLTNLVYLDLSVNNFGGQIPSEMSQLTNLVHLDLSFNGWYNQFQISYHTIPQLDIPNLREPVRNLSSLSELYLDGVNLSDKKNRGWCHHLSSSLPNIQMLTMGYCSLIGPIDASI
ncbi:receptor-like protein 43 [Macadamia integrifolia]|uniref:receptor-like protein 43 n=1 Tax=Macadamia integrifolia TaxID=60698 RepID=UPI001C531EDA|nr:receptor-like protein 43 [Macadamia integrifolia]